MICDTCKYVNNYRNKYPCSECKKYYTGSKYESISKAETQSKMKVYLVLVDSKVSQTAFFTDKEAIKFIMSRSHPVINGEGWNFEAIDKDGKVTHYQITDVMIGG